MEVSILLVVALVWGEVSYFSWVMGEMVEGEGGGAAEGWRGRGMEGRRVEEEGWRGMGGGN